MNCVVAMLVDSQKQVALEFGYDNSLISLALKKCDCTSASELIDYIDKYEADLENDGKTIEVDVAQKAEAAGIDPSGKTVEEVQEEIEAAEE